MLPLQSNRLILRRFQQGDLSPFLAYRNDPEVARYQSWDEYSSEKAQAFIERQITQPEGEPGSWLQIALARKSTNELIGDCGLRLHAPDPRQATIGITLSRSQQKQGLATEALSCLFDHLFRHRQLHRIMLDTDPKNTPMWRLAERLGLRREAHHRQSLWFKGQPTDEYIYAILRVEWMEKAPINTVAYSDHS